MRKRGSDTLHCADGTRAATGSLFRSNSLQVLHSWHTAEHWRMMRLHQTQWKLGKRQHIQDQPPESHPGGQQTLHDWGREHDSTGSRQRGRSDVDLDAASTLSHNQSAHQASWNSSLVSLCLSLFWPLLARLLLARLFLSLGQQVQSQCKRLLQVQSQAEQGGAWKPALLELRGQVCPWI